jgi:hypothetical protein
VAIQGAKAIAVNTDGCCNGRGTTADAESLANANDHSKAISNAKAIAVDTAIPGQDVGLGANAQAQSLACDDLAHSGAPLGSNCFAYSGATAVAKDTGAADARSFSNATFGGIAVTQSKAKAVGGTEVSEGTVICPQPADQSTCAAAGGPGYLPSNATSMSVANSTGPFNLAVANTDSSATNGGNAAAAAAANSQPTATPGFGVAYQKECESDNQECASALGVVASNGTAGAAIGDVSATSNTAGGAANAATGVSTTGGCPPVAPSIVTNVDPMTGKKTTTFVYNTGGVCAASTATTAQPAP